MVQVNLWWKSGDRMQIIRTVFQAYQSALTSAALQENVAKTASLEPQYLKERVSVSRGSVADENATNSMGYARLRFGSVVGKNAREYL